MRRKWVIVLLILCSFNLKNTTEAHPHLFIKPSISIVHLDNKRLGLKVLWEWDEWWSMDVINDCDRDHNGIFDHKEIKLVFNDYFKGAEEFDYFTVLKVNKKKQPITVTDFTARIEPNNIVTYSFIIPLNFMFDHQNKSYHFSIAFNDETFYIAFPDKIGINESTKHKKYRNLKTTTVSYYGVKLEFNYTEE